MVVSGSSTCKKHMHITHCMHGIADLGGSSERRPLCSSTLCARTHKVCTGLSSDSLGKCLRRTERGRFLEAVLPTLLLTLAHSESPTHPYADAEADADVNDVPTSAGVGRLKLERRGKEQESSRAEGVIWGDVRVVEVVKHSDSHQS